MSLVGPRPDVPGFADQLEGDDRIMLNVRHASISRPGRIAAGCRECGAVQPRSYLHGKGPA
jgi:hypothetical protein